jgi:DNA-binding response OmpR family regulator
MRVLLVEDHQELAETVADALRSEGMAVDVALDGQAALDRAGITDPFTATVKVTIGRLRAKLGDPRLIETIREAGYRIGAA